MYNCSWWFGFSSISFYQKAALLSSLAAFLMSNFGLLFFYSPSFLIPGTKLLFLTGASSGKKEIPQKSGSSFRISSLSKSSIRLFLREHAPFRYASGPISMISPIPLPSVSVTVSSCTSIASKNRTAAPPVSEASHAKSASRPLIVTVPAMASPAAG